MKPTDRDIQTMSKMFDLEVFKSIGLNPNKGGEKNHFLKLVRRGWIKISESLEDNSYVLTDRGRGILIKGV